LLLLLLLRLLSALQENIASSRHRHRTCPRVMQYVPQPRMKARLVSAQIKTTAATAGVRVTCCSCQLQSRDDVDCAREQHLPLQLHEDKSRRV
jgi:hypothetical protein